MMRDAPFTGTDHKGTVETIQDEILHRICFVDYAPGQQLKEAELATEFGVSRTPVRDAISRISHLGLVETRNGVGTVVIALTPAKIRDVYEMRLELAPLIGVMTPNAITEIHRNEARALWQASCDLADVFDTRQYVEINHRLHGLIASLIGNSVLHSVWWQSYIQAASTWYSVAQRLGPVVSQALIAELTEIRTALDNDDTAAVGFIQRTHIGYGYQRIKTHLLMPDVD